MLTHLRIIGLLEGISYILLLGVCMPLKYLYNMPEATSIVGMAHGVLFVYFCLLVIWIGLQRDWSYNKIILGLISSLLPFGTFVADLKLFREYSTAEKS